MTHKYNVGDTVWVADPYGNVAPSQMTITEIHIDNIGAYYDGGEKLSLVTRTVRNKSEKLLFLTQEDCIKFTNKCMLNICLKKRNALLDELEALNTKIKSYEELVKWFKEIYKHCSPESAEIFYEEPGCCNYGTYTLQDGCLNDRYVDEKDFPDYYDDNYWEDLESILWSDKAIDVVVCEELSKSKED